MMASSGNEPIRLLIWDLDETLWNGKLDEGDPIEIIPQNRAITVELSQRGIVNSICSKNDLEKARCQLQALGLWEYFVFPSIDWTAKGPRLKNLISSMGLRPSSVVFVDDELRNRVEAQTYVPELRSISPEYLPAILTDPLFRGKPDPELSRLRQYRVLQKREEDRQGSQANLTEFLRNANISATIDYDIIGNIDRAIELIN
jgi:FkbH-like protein